MTADTIIYIMSLYHNREIAKKNGQLEVMMKKTTTKKTLFKSTLKKSCFLLTPLLMLSCSSQSPVQNKQNPNLPVIKTAQQNTQVSKKHSPNHQQPTYTPTTNITAKTTTPNYNPHSNKNGYQSFYDWKNDFARRAIAKGYNSHDVQRLLDTAQYNSRVVSLDKNQAEFVKMPWEYVENAVSDSKIRLGQSKFANNPNTFGNISNQYSVSPYIVTAIWGMESSYGGFTGNSNIASSLATLAYDGRRRQFAENQLLALLTLLQRGDVSWYNLDGSWAGGMGHTQFIPATWLAQGVDANGDGRRNPWNADDALSSTANYLTRSGWVRGLQPFYEVRLPAHFDYLQTGATKSISQWQQQGVQLMGGYANGANSSTQATLWLPAGKDGPALLTTKNFNVIKVYNNSSSYALGVSLLAKEIAGRGGLIKAWPKYEQPLTRGQAVQLQQRLTTAGFDTKGVDGVIGRNTRKAFQRWQAVNGQIPDGFICQRTAQSLIW